MRQMRQMQLCLCCLHAPQSSVLPCTMYTPHSFLVFLVFMVVLQLVHASNYEEGREAARRSLLHALVVESIFVGQLWGFSIQQCLLQSYLPMHGGRIERQIGLQEGLPINLRSVKEHGKKMGNVDSKQGVVSCMELYLVVVVMTDPQMNCLHA